MTQLTMFSSVSGQIEVGDVASSKSAYVWIVEQFLADRWFPCDGAYFAREDARQRARELRTMYGMEVRVLAYKATIDVKGRFNRQVRKMRADY